MIQIRITSYLLQQAVHVLINSGRLIQTPTIMSRSIMISRHDLEETGKILDRSLIRYTIKR